MRGGGGGGGGFGFDYVMWGRFGFDYVISLDYVIRGGGVGS